VTAAQRAEIVIIGGGLAGSAAAIQLARAGRDVLLLERSTGPHHKVCGEFLSAEALTYLGALGADLAALGAVPIHSVRLAGVTRDLPFRAMSVTRCCLDEELLRLAAEAGATVLRGHRVQQLSAPAGGWQARLDDWQVKLDDSNEVTAPTVFLATGKHDLHGYPRPLGKQAGLVGLKMYFRLTAEQIEALRGRVELLLYRGGYAGLQPVEDGVANLCCLVDRAVLQQLSGRWEHLLAAMQQQCPELRERLIGAQPLLEKPLAITSIPYGYVRGCSHATAGLWALGDQAAVIPSFTGDGMSIALHSGSVAAQMYLAGATSAAFQRCLHAELHRQVALATLVSRGLVSPVTRHFFAAAVGVWPGLLGLVARQTRITRVALSARSL
jgi:flavin-dependent dehydrogenase